MSSTARQRAAWGSFAPGTASHELTQRIECRRGEHVWIRGVGQIVSHAGQHDSAGPAGVRPLQRHCQRRGRVARDLLVDGSAGEQGRSPRRKLVCDRGRVDSVDGFHVPPAGAFINSPLLLVKFRPSFSSMTFSSREAGARRTHPQFRATATCRNSAAAAAGGDPTIVSPHLHRRIRIIERCCRL